MTATPTRRAVLLAGGGALLAGGCASASTPAAPSTTSTTAAGTTLAKVTDVPTGGGLVLPDAKVVLTRTGDTVHAFSAVCTHQNCLVATVYSGAIHCPCHGSAFDATTGAVTAGPATRPLPAVAVTVADGVVRTA